MCIVALHHAVDAEDSSEKKGQQRDVVFSCQEDVGLIELLDVIGTVVRRKSDTREDDLCSTGFEGGKYLVEVRASVFNAETSQAVVAAKLNDNDCRF